MSERDEPKDDDRDSTPDDDADERDSSPPPPKVKASKSGGKRRNQREAVVAPKPSGMSSNAVALGVLGLALGAAAGWFGHIHQAKSALKAEEAAATASGAKSSGSCGAWEKKICETGEQSAACQEAKAAVDLLTPTACDAALATVPATLTKIKAGRAKCDQLVSKLCQDLSPGSTTCEMVKARTPSFPPDRCKEMLDNYDQVIGELKSIEEQQGGMPGGMPGGPQRMPGGPGGPGGMPRLKLPQ